MRLLLVALLSFVCGPALAQSGTITFASGFTNNTFAPSLPPANPGNTRAYIEATSKFDQGLTVNNGFAFPCVANASFTNRVEIRCGSVVIAERESGTSVVDLVCDFGVTKVRRSQFVSCSATVTLNTFELLGPPIVHNTTRCTVAMQLPFGDGSMYHQTTSRAGTEFYFEMRP